MIPTYRSIQPTHHLHPTTFYLQGNDARLQLVPASTTTKANRANKNESAALQTAGVGHLSPLTTNLPRPIEVQREAHRMPSEDRYRDTATTAGSAAEHTTIEIDCRVCSDHHHGRQIAGTATTEPIYYLLLPPSQRLHDLQRGTHQYWYRLQDLQRSPPYNNRSTAGSAAINMSQECRVCTAASYYHWNRLQGLQRTPTWPTDCRDCND
jgi:hypothetical protein